MTKIFFATLVLLNSTLSLAQSPDKKPSSMAKKMQRQPASVNAAAEVVMIDKGGWVRIDGEGARKMYENLGSAAKDNQGEAGEGILFKTGTNYECWMDKTLSPAVHSCVFSLKDSKKGVVR